MISILLIIICFIFIIAFILFSKKMKTYIIKEWPSHVLNVCTLIISISSAFIIFDMTIKNNKDIEINNFKKTYVAILYELSANRSEITSFISILNDKKRLPGPQPTFSINVIHAALTNPLFYKYSGSDYVYAVNRYIARVEFFNDQAHKIYADHYEDSILSHKLSVYLNELADLTLRYIGIFQVLTQYYVMGYDAKLGPSTPIAGEAMSWLKMKPLPSQDDCTEFLKKLEAMPQNEQKAMQKSIKKETRFNK